MPSNETLDQIQRLLESDDTIPQNVSNGLLLVALRAVYQEGKSRTDTLTALDESIRGNGKPGLNQRITLIEEWAKSQVWFQRLLIGVIVAEAIGLIYHYITP